MRTKTVWRAWWLAALVALAPGGAHAQDAGVDYAPPANAILPLPLYSTNPAAGGFFMAGGYAMYRGSTPLKDQLVAVRGFTVTDPTVPNQAQTTTIVLGVPSGAFFGDRTEVLDVSQVSGPGTYQPGFTIEGGWRFSDGSALTASWMWLTTARMNAVATTINRPFQDFGADLASSFLSSFVFNFPAGFNGPLNKITIPTPGAVPPFEVVPGAVIGIWNGASTMTEVFEQRFSQIEATYRVPFYETECFRMSGIIGPRFSWIWERYQWRTFDTGLDQTGSTIISLSDNPSWEAIYTNIVSNRMYGVHVGCSEEWYIGKGFAAQLELQGALFLDVVREKVTYETGVRKGVPQNKRTITDYTFVPELQATPYIMWYPWEGIQMKFGFDIFAFFNTIGSPRPIDFNYSALDPNFEHIFRWYNGVTASIAFVF
jgi:hypothetical protein